jgi:hypothetical protein
LLQRSETSGHTAVSYSPEVAARNSLSRMTGGSPRLRCPYRAFATEPPREPKQANSLLMTLSLTLVGFLPLQRIRKEESAESWGLQPPPRSDLSVSHALAGLLLFDPLRVYCAPVTLMGFTFRAFVHMGLRKLVATAPLLPFHRCTQQRLRLQRLNPHTARLRHRT